MKNTNINIKRGIISGMKEMEGRNWHWEAFVPVADDIAHSFTDDSLSYFTYDAYENNYYSNPLIDDFHARLVTYARLIDSL